ncbi:hypothetical protein SCHPADRAFT_947687 [Schizopora paradoxa]|uniref:Uncharacterized protein n=1 Tax=Schizopora paradoxa TaxID=27342 RepID=A0A0H2QZN7_9AGAM|nr:hypothetical protein SCHPADRAFT_947687 [Schizopora paradoxa]
MDGVSSCLEALRKAVATSKSKSKKHLQEKVENLSSLVLLVRFPSQSEMKACEPNVRITQNSSSPSPKAFERLAKLLRSPLLPLYSGFPECAISLATSILAKTFEELSLHLLDTPEISGRGDVKGGWENVAGSLISGLMDFLESEDASLSLDQKKTLIGDAFYHPLCQMFFSRSVEQIDNIAVTLRNNAYMLLSDTAAHHSSNQAKLRVSKLLGPEKLGEVIFGTKHYSTLETLLNLLATLLPSPSSSRSKFESFVSQAFSNRKGLDGSKVSCITTLLDGVAAKNWEETASKLYDQISATDISFPQAYDVDKVVVCGIDFPQPESSDRFYIDKTGLFINAQRDDGLYDSLQVPFESISDIDIGSCDNPVVTVRFSLSTIPLLVDEPLDPKSPDQPLDLVVDIANEDLSSFMDCLKHRRIDGKIVGHRRASKARTRISITDSARLDFDDDGLFLSDPHSPSQKAHEIQKFYEMSDPFDLSKRPCKVNVKESTKASTTSAKKEQPKDNRAAKQNERDDGAAEVEPNDVSLSPVKTVPARSMKTKSGNVATKAKEKPVKDLSPKAGVSDDEEKQSSSKKKRTPKSKKLRVLSDDEDEIGILKLATKPAATKGQPNSTKRTKEKHTTDETQEVKKGTGQSTSNKKSKLTAEKTKQDLKKADDLNPQGLLAGKTEVSAKEPGRHRRAKRASAIVATAKLAVQEGSNDDNDALLSGVEDLDGVNGSPPLKKKVSESARVSQFPASLAHSGNVAEKNSKDGGEEAILTSTKATKTKEKRPLADDDDQDTRKSKKPRIAKETPDKKKQAVTEIETNTPAPARPQQTYKHRDRKALHSSPRKAATDVDWDSLPSDAKKKTKAPSAKPVKTEKKPETKKENPKRKEAQEKKPQEDKRAPFAEISTAVNLKEKKFKAKEKVEKSLTPKAPTKNESVIVVDGPEYNPSPGPVIPAKKEVTKQGGSANPGPSLADILLKGAMVQSDTASLPEIDLAPIDVDEVPEPETMVEEQMVVVPEVPDHDQAGSARRHRKIEEPHTTNDNAPIDEVLHAVTDEIQIDRMNEAIDLTRASESVTRPPLTPITDRVAGPPLASSPDIQDNTFAQGLARSKVKFDDRLQFKSASSEWGAFTKNIPLADTKRKNERTRAKPKQLQHIERMPREERSAAAQQHRWEKEPGMMDIINDTGAGFPT